MMGFKLRYSEEQHCQNYKSTYSTQEVKQAKASLASLTNRPYLRALLTLRHSFLEQEQRKQLKALG